MSSSLVRVLHCSVCDNSFGTRKDWLNHLLLPEHQDKARLECRSWDKAARECVLVAYSSFPIANEEVLNYFSKDDGDGGRNETIVTDFVWFPNRPKVGIIQFESKWKVSEVWERNGNQPEVRIQNQMVQIKMGCVLMTLEWLELIPDADFPRLIEISKEASRRLPPSRKLKKKKKTNKVDESDAVTRSDPELKKRKKKKADKLTNQAADGDNPNQPNLTSVDISSGSRADSTPETLAKKQKAKKTSKVDKSAAVTKPDLEMKKQKKKKAGKLTYQAADGDNSNPLDATLVDMPISSSGDQRSEPPAKKQKKKKTSKMDKYATSGGGGVDEQPKATTMDLAYDLGSTSSALVSQFNEIRCEVEIPDEQYNFALELMGKLEQVFKETFPSCKVYFLRHCYHKLRTVAGDHLLLYLDLGGSIGQQKMELHQLITQDIMQVLLTDSAQKISCKRIQNSSDSQALHHGIQVLHTPTSTNFTLAVHRMQLVEVQTSRLLKYMVSFSSKARAVFTLIHHWAKVNNIRFANIPKLAKKEHNVKAREPAALEWLLACFLGNKQVIPTPRQVMSRGRREPFNYCNLDIGFIEDEEYVSQWKAKRSSSENGEDYVLGTLKLVGEFFAFLSYLATIELVVNTRDGELLEKQVLRDFVAGKPVENLGKLTNLTMEELNRICFDEKKEALVLNLVRNDELVIVSPFLWHAQFSFDNRNFFTTISRAVKQSGDKIENFLTSLESGSQNEVDLKSLLQL